MRATYRDARVDRAGAGVLDRLGAVLVSMEERARIVGGDVQVSTD
jgi:hypothetical protein